METNKEFNNKFHDKTVVIEDEQQNERVGFFLAKLAYEKGFDWKTLYSVSMTIGSGESKLYSNPTRSVLQRWLREVHNIHIKIEYLFILNKYYYQIYSNDQDKINFEIEVLTRDIDDYIIYNTYEEATDIGIEESLNRLPDAKKA